MVTTTVVTETQTSVTVEPLEPLEPLEPSEPPRSHPQPPMIPPQEHASLSSMPPLPSMPSLPLSPSGIVSSQGIVSSLFRDSRASRQVVLHAGKRNTMTVVRLSGKLKKSCLVFARQVQPGVDKMVPIKPLKNATVGDRNVGAHRVHVEFMKELFIHRVPPERKTQEVVQALRLLVNHPCNFTIRTQAENLQERRWENHILRMTRPQPPALEELPWRKAEFVQQLRDMEDGLEGMRHVAVQVNQPVVLWCLQLLENVLSPLFHFHEEEGKQAVGAELAQSQSPV